MADWRTHTHTLSRPVKLDGGTITVVTLREPDAEALEKIEETGIFKEPPKAKSKAKAADAPEEPNDDAPEALKMSIRQTRQMVEALIDGDPAIAKKLHASDLMALVEAAGPLLEGAMDQGSATSR
jgi:hypothetical protein